MVLEPAFNTCPIKTSPAEKVRGFNDSSEETHCWPAVVFLLPWNCFRLEFYFKSYTLQTKLRYLMLLDCKVLIYR